MRRPSIAESAAKTRAALAAMKQRKQELRDLSKENRQVIATLQYDTAGQVFIQSIKDDIDRTVQIFLSRPDVPEHKECVAFWTKCKTLMEMAIRLETTIESDDENNEEENN